MAGFLPLFISGKMSVSYVVHTGDTIAAVTRKLGCSFKALKQANPEAMGRTRDGRWFLKDGSVLQSPGGFPLLLAAAGTGRLAPPAAPPPAQQLDDNGFPVAETAEKTQEPPPNDDSARSSAPVPETPAWAALAARLALTLDTPAALPRSPEERLSPLSQSASAGGARLALNLTPDVDLNLGYSAAGTRQSRPAGFDSPVQPESFSVGLSFRF